MLLATGAGMTLTRTEWGREHVRQLVLEELNGGIRGRIEIDAVVGGDVLRRVRLAGVRIYEPGGEQFARADTVVLNYRWSELLVGNVVFRKLTLVGPVMRLSRSTDGRWNYAEVFSGRGRGDEGSSAGEVVEGGRRKIVLREVAIRSGDLSLSVPWQPEDSAEVEDSRWHLERVDGGWRRVFRVERLNARLPIIRLSAPGESGQLFEIVQLSGRLTALGEPIEIEQLRADIEFRGDTLAFDIWDGVLPESHLFGQGWVKLASRAEYDLTLSGNAVSTRELLWLEPRLPIGVAQVDFHLRSLEDGFAVEVKDAEWESADATVAGRFGMKLRRAGSEVEFDSVKLDVGRMSTTLIHALTGWESPVDGELSGRVDLDGDLSELRVDADVRLQPELLARASRVRLSGALDAREDSLGAENLELRFDTLSLDLVRAILPGLAVGGRIAGSARLDGRLAEGLAVNFDIEQRDGDLAPTRLRGDGTIVAAGGKPPRLNLAVHVDMVSLTSLSEYYPAIPFRGEFKGELLALGPLNDLRLEAHLAGPSDSIKVEGLLQLTGEVVRYRAEARGWRVKLASFRAGLRASDLDFRAEFAGEGVALAEMKARGRAHVFSSFVGGVAFDSARADFRVADGRLLVDTAVVSAEFGELRGSGALGLAPGVVDSLIFELDADSLGGVNPWLFPAYEPLAMSGLAAGGDGEAGGEGEATLLEGSARVRGRIVGQLGRFSVTASLEGRRVRHGDWTADSLSVDRFEASGFGEALRLSGRLIAVGVGLGGFRLDSARVEGETVDRNATVEFALAGGRGAEATGRVRIAAGKEVRTLDIEALTVGVAGSKWRLEEPSTVRLAASGAKAIQDLRIVSSGGRIVVGGLVGVSGPASFIVGVEGLDLGEVESLWPDSLGLAGKLQLHAELSGSTRNPVARADFELADGRLLGVSFSSFRGTLGYEAGEMAVDVSMWREGAQLFRLHGTLPLDLSLPGFHLSLPERAIRMTFQGDSIPLTLATALTDQIADPRGYAQADTILIRGSPRDVSLVGELRLIGGGVRVVKSGIVYERLMGDLVFRGSVMKLKDVTFRGAEGGRGVLTGTINVSNPRNPEFALKLRADELPGYDQLDARVVLSGTAELVGPYDKPEVTGKLSVVSGVLYVEEIGRQREIIDPFEEGFELIDTVFGSERVPGRGRRNAFLEHLTIDIDLEVARDAWLRSESSNVEIAGNLKVYMQPAQHELRMDGTLQALRGEYWLFNRRFEVVEGTIDFVGTPALNPNLRIVARYTVQTQKKPIEIRLVIGGTLENLTLTLESNAQPPIPESDLLSYLLFGRPSYEITQAGGEGSSLLQDVAAGAPQAFVSYALGSLLVGETGIAYVDVSRAPAAGGQSDYAGGVAPALTATQVEVGWYLAPTVFVSVAQQLVGAVRHPTVRVEWRLDKYLTLQGITEPRFGRAATVFSEGSGTDLEQSIGVFLFYGWAY